LVACGGGGGGGRGGRGGGDSAVGGGRDGRPLLLARQPDLDAENLRPVQRPERGGGAGLMRVVRPTARTS